jgi:hypothetical protein
MIHIQRREGEIGMLTLSALQQSIHIGTKYRYQFLQQMRMVLCSAMMAPTSHNCVYNPLSLVGHCAEGIG